MIPFWLFPLLLQAGDVVGAGSVVPEKVWFDYPLVALLAVVLFYQGRKMDKLADAVNSLVGAHMGSREEKR